jgi:hypothetical protein
MMQAKLFLTATLGNDGFEALSKARERLPELESVFVPRAVIAWLDCATRLGYEGAVPGTGATIAKGELTVDGYKYDLQDPMRASSALVASLLENVTIPQRLEPKQIARLGKSIDTLTKAKFLKRIKELEDSAKEESSSASESSESQDGDDLEKGIEEPGAAAKPKEPSGFGAPVAPRKAPQTGTGQKPPAPAVGPTKGGPGVAQPLDKCQISRTRGFYKSELTKSCDTCGQTQMRGRQVVGCLCVTEILQSSDLIQKHEGDRVILSGFDEVICALEDKLGLPTAG